MKFGLRVPSWRKRVAARTSWRRVVRHSLGLKAPRGWGWLTNPRRAAYNRIYNRTTVGLGRGCALAAAVIALALLMAATGIAVVVIGALSSGSAHAAVARQGREFQVNTFTTSGQDWPAVATDAFGNFVVVWHSLEPDGFGVGVFGQRFAATGARVGSEFRVSGLPRGVHFTPAAAMNPAGDFVVVWAALERQRPPAFEVLGRSFSSAGEPKGAEFRVNTGPQEGYPYPVIGMDGEGDFVVVWQSDGRDGSGYGVFGQRFRGNGSAAGPEFRINEHTMGSQSQPSVAMDSAGNFVVAWQSDGQDGSDEAIIAKWFDSRGVDPDHEFQVNTFTTGRQRQPSVGISDSGDFVVAWQGFGPGNSGYGIFARRFDRTRNAIAPEFQVSGTMPGWQFYPAVGLDRDGDFVATWTSYTYSGYGLAVAGRRFDRNDKPTGPEFEINTYAPGHQLLQAIAVGPSGNFVVAWESQFEDGSSTGIFGQRFSGRAPTLIAPAVADTLDCSDPLASQPTFTWSADGYETFRVHVAWDPAFDAGHTLDSGSRRLTTTSWMPPAKKWEKICASALAAHPRSPRLYLKVSGADRDLPEGDPTRQASGPVVLVIVTR
ncbi:MAG: hypothetical protein HY049_01955 [Acidobacteria bacterium]|nr:hypothetical protein [Acidobacteriota bacterium]